MLSSPQCARLVILLLCTGANDYFSIVFQNNTVTVETVTGYIKDAMMQLYAKGARKCAAPSSDLLCLAARTKLFGEQIRLQRSLVTFC